MAKAVELLRSTNKSVLNNLAIFIYKSFHYAKPGLML